MRWDDLQLLRSIDAMEESGQHLGSGLNLLELLAQEAGIPMYETMGEFAIELALARDADFVTWIDRSGQVGRHATPTDDPDLWPQSFDGIQLSLGGRDRARGRIIQKALPDPTEDDGRIITGLTMEEIARAIGHTYTATQLPRYLRE